MYATFTNCTVTVRTQKVLKATDLSTYYMNTAPQVFLGPPYSIVFPPWREEMIK